MASSKKKKKTSRKKKKSQVQIYSWKEEGLGLALLVLSGTLLLSILSYQYTSGTSQTTNLLGPAGHFISTLLVGFFGWCSLLAVAWITWAGWRCWADDDYSAAEGEYPVITSIIGALGILVFSSAFFAIFFRESGGGLLGVSVANPLLRLVSATGASILCICGFLYSLALATRQTLQELVRGSFWFIWDSGVFLVLDFPHYVLPVFQGIWDFCLSLTDFFRNIFFLRAKSAPKKNRKKAKRKFELEEEVLDDDDWDEDDEGEEYEDDDDEEEYEYDEEFDDVDEDEDDMRDYSQIVVQRRARQREQKSKVSDPWDSRKQAREEYYEETEYGEYTPPSLDLLTPGGEVGVEEDDDLLRNMSALIEEKLQDFKVRGRVTRVHPGPVITMFEFEPAPGVKVGKIAALQDDLAMSLRATSIRILAPIPNKGTVGIEVPNREREIVRLRDLLESEELAKADSILSVPLGKDTYGDPIVVDIAQMPHLLMAGATGTGKSVCINSLLLSLLYRSSPAELGLILIDPKILELSVYEGVPHLRCPVVTVAKQAKAVLEWAVSEMDRRYRLMQQYGVRSLDGFNQLVCGEEEYASRGPINSAGSSGLISLEEKDVIEDGTVVPEDTEVGEELSAEEGEGILPVEQLKPLPRMLIVIDELADLMLSVGREIEDLIARLAQKARAAGIHMVLATQRPSVDVITGLIKANFPARLSFRVTSRVDSRTILDIMGAEKLLGRGDMLFLSPGSPYLKRLHGAFVSDSEVQKVMQELKEDYDPHYDQQIVAACEKALQDEDGKGDGSLSDEIEYDVFYDKAVDLVMQKGQASTSMLQRAFRIGYNRAARIIDTMEIEGVVGPADGSRPREVLYTAESE